MYRISLTSMLAGLTLTVACGGKQPQPDTPRLPVAAIDLRGNPAVGETLTFDGRASHDPDGATVSHAWWIGEAPAASEAALVGDDQPEASLVPDAAGVYEVWLAVEDPDGRSTPVSVRVEVAEPTARPVASASFAPLYPTVYHPVELRSDSWDPDGDAVHLRWSLNTPHGSQAVLADAEAATTTFIPDVVGSYYVELVASDGEGAGAPKQLHVIVLSNAAPTARWAYVGNARVGQTLTLDAQGSTDPEGDPLTFEWEAHGPAGSVASLTDPGQALTRLTPDRPGDWRIVLTVRDPWSASRREMVLRVAYESLPSAKVEVEGLVTVSYSQVALTDRPLVLDGSGSTDGTSSTFAEVAWEWASRPEGSQASLTASGLTARAIPDVEGAYQVRLTVTDEEGLRSEALTSFQARSLTLAEPLPWTPSDLVYSHGLDRVVIATADPAQLLLLDPQTDETVSIELPKAALAVALAPDGQTAVVGHDGWLTLVDLVGQALVRSVAVPFEVGDLETDGAMAWILAAGDYRVRAVDLADGSVQEGGSYFSTQVVRLHPDGDRLYLAGTSRLERVDLDAAGLPADTSTYYTSTSACGGLWLSGGGSLALTGCGTVYRTSSAAESDLVYAGTFGESLLGADHDAEGGWIAALAKSGYSGPARLVLADDAFLEPRAERDLPSLLVDGRVEDASTGWVFFDAARENLHVFLKADGASTGWAHTRVPVADLLADP